MTDQEKRQRAIRDIESLYPPDAPYPATAKVGQRLLEQAKREVSLWKNEPTEVLVRMAQLCRAKDRENVKSKTNGQRNKV